MMKHNRQTNRRTVEMYVNTYVRRAGGRLTGQKERENISQPGGAPARGSGTSADHLELANLLVVV